MSYHTLNLFIRRIITDACFCKNIINLKLKIMKKITFIILSFVVSLYSCSSESQNITKNKNANTIQPASDIPTDSIKQIPNKQVCMVNNKFMNKDQTPVPVGENIYYGCCQGCVSALKNDTTSRFIFDPETGEEVDKANAFIIIKPGSKDEVLYFKSETTAKKYLESHNKH